MTTIKTERLLLRPPEPADLPVITGLLDDLPVSRMLARVPHPYRLEHAEGWFARVNNGPNASERVFAVCLDGRPVGMVGFQDRDGEPTLGYWLGRPYWGRGLMSEAVQAAVGWFFENRQEAMLYSGAFEENVASLRIQEKTGFEITGSAQLECVATGEWRPEIRTRLSRDAFRSARAGNPSAAAQPLTAGTKQAR
jgi:RimJ/RimL family protein N-acetyltransferase